MLKNRQRFFFIVLISGSIVHSISILAMQTKEEIKVTTDAEEQQILELTLALSANKDQLYTCNNNQAQIVSIYNAIAKKIEKLKTLYGKEKTLHLLNGKDISFNNLETAQEMLVHLTRLISLHHEETKTKKRDEQIIAKIAQQINGVPFAKSSEPEQQHIYNNPSRALPVKTKNQLLASLTKETPRVYFSKNGILTGSVFNTKRESSCPISTEKFKHNMKIAHLECGHTLSFKSFNELLTQQKRKMNAASYHQQKSKKQTSSRHCPICLHSFDKMKNVYIGRLPAAATLPQKVILKADNL